MVELDVTLDFGFGYELDDTAVSTTISSRTAGLLLSQPRCGVVDMASTVARAALVAITATDSSTLGEQLI